MNYLRPFTGEFLGTFLLVLFGCGAVIVSVVFNAYSGIFQIGIVWGIAVALAIYATRHLSCAHLNPAVSIAMVVGKRMPAKNLPLYLTAQFGGAFVAAILLFMLFNNSITAYELQHDIIRGSEQSVRTAMMFGEFYSNHGEGKIATISLINALSAEAFGTFLLVLLIFSLTEGCNVGRPDNNLSPIFIGLAVTSIICLIGPLTQAGLNPARDFSPRLFSWLAGWRDAALPDRQGGFFWVYILGPVAGGASAALLFVSVIEPAMRAKSKECC